PQPPSRPPRAPRWAAATPRLARPTSSGWVGPPPRAGGSRVAATWSRAARVSAPPGRAVGGRLDRALGTGPSHDPPRRGVVVEEAAQVPVPQRRGPPPAGPGEPAGFQAAAGQLGQGISPTLG